jgi:hypothetical protein
VGEGDARKILLFEQKKPETHSLAEADCAPNPLYLQTAVRNYAV